MTTKPVPYLTASCQMLADKDKMMTTKPAPHKAAASGQKPADEAMMTMPGGVDLAAEECGNNPSVDDKELAGAVDKDKEEPLAVN